MAYRALLLGVSNYDDGAFPSLKGPLNDVAALERVLTDPTTKLVDTVARRTDLDLSTMTATMNDFFAEASRGDQLLLYFSGHGKRDLTNHFYLCAKDTKPDRLPATALSDDTINRMIDDSRASAFVIVLDCCHAGAFKSDLDIAARLQGEGRYVFAACRGAQLAEDAPEADGNSIFTGHIIDAIEWPGTDRNGDGILSMDEIYEEVGERLAKTSRMVSQRQVSNATGTIPVVRARTASPAATERGHPTTGTAVAAKSGFPEGNDIGAWLGALATLRPTDAAAFSDAAEARGLSPPELACLDAALLRHLFITTVPRRALNHALNPSDKTAPVIFGGRPAFDASETIADDALAISTAFDALFERDAFRRPVVYEAVARLMPPEASRPLVGQSRRFLAHREYLALHEKWGVGSPLAWSFGYWNRRRALVMNGGSVKGLAFLGALTELQKWVHLPFDVFCGTSAGAICAAALAMGYDVPRLKETMWRLSFESILDDGWDPLEETDAPWDRPAKKASGTLRYMAQRALGLPLSLVQLGRRGWLHSTAPLGRFVSDLLDWRPSGNGAFPSIRVPSDDTELGWLPHPLRTVAATSNSKSAKRIFAKPDVRVEHAVRCSMAIPVFFQRERDGGDVVYDGGMLDNFPTESVRDSLESQERFVFKDRKHRRDPDQDEVFGLYLHDGQKRYRAGDDGGLLGVFRCLAHIYLGQDEGRKLEALSVIKLDISPIGTLDFGLREEDKQLLFDAGRAGVLHFLYANQPPHGLLYRGEPPTKAEVDALDGELKHRRVEARRHWWWRRWLGRLASLLPIALVVVAYFVWRETSDRTVRMHATPELSPLLARVVPTSSPSTPPVPEPASSPKLLESKIEGSLVLENGGPVKNAEVSVKDVPSCGTVHSDGQGRFVFENCVTLDQLPNRILSVRLAGLGPCKAELRAASPDTEELQEALVVRCEPQPPPPLPECKGTEIYANRGGLSPGAHAFTCNAAGSCVDQSGKFRRNLGCRGFAGSVTEGSE
ncbi:MAG: patatin-like phospholipase family protein [Myxococcales bacterium]|nr:patatin-like phospholipase family protein [Myxococcales bacterium]